jgi:hypothetical protein
MAKLVRLTGQMSGYWKPATEADMEELSSTNELTIELEKKRTTKQNRAMWLYCEMLSEALNDAGYDMLTFPWKEGLEIPFSKQECMERFWRPVMQAMLGVDSTTKQSMDNVFEVYKVVDKAISTKTGVTVDWPSIESQLMAHYSK